MSKKQRDQSRTERATAIRAAQARKERNRKFAIGAVVVAALSAVIAVGVWYGGGSSTPAADQPVSGHVGEQSLIIGKDTAPLKVVIYEDFQCPFCRQFELSSRTYLREAVSKGKVQVDYRPFNLLSDLPYSSRALNAFAAVLADGTPEQALALHDMFFDKQPYEQSSASISNDTITTWVKDVGAGNPAVLAALKTTNEAFFKATSDRANADRVQGTPTVFVNGKLLTGQGAGQMADNLETMIAKQK